MMIVSAWENQCTCCIGLKEDSDQRDGGYHG